MNKPKVSVLIPCYNVEKYLYQCLDSVVNQTLKEIEIICINDGSKDSTLSILKEYAQKDSRIVIIDKENSGYGASMNKGLQKATGEYIGIVEPDDFIELNMFATLYSLKDPSNPDIIKSNYSEFNKKNEYRKINKFTSCKNCSNLDIPEFVLKGHPCIWTAIYKHDFLKCKDIRFNETPGAAFQDIGFNIKSWTFAKDIVSTTESLYNYRIDNENSSINKGHQMAFVTLNEYNILLNYLSKYNISEKIWHVICAKAFSGGFYYNYQRRLCKNYLKYISEWHRLLKKFEKYIVLKEFLSNKKILNKQEMYVFKKILNNHIIFYIKSLFIVKKIKKSNSKVTYLFRKLPILEKIQDKTKKTIKICKINFFKIKYNSNGYRKKVKFLGINIPIKNISKYKIIMYFFDFIIPKNKRKIIFHSVPDFSDNSLEFYRYLKNNKKKYKMVWICSNKHIKKTPKEIKKTYFVESIKGLYHLLSAKYIISTHWHLVNVCNFKRRHKLIELWHGMPFKTLGYNEKNIPCTTLKKYVTMGKNGYFFVSSDIFKLSMISSFLIPDNNIYITGQARTDCIIDQRNKKEVANFIEKKSFKKVILYTPTYKEAQRNNRRDINKEFENIFYFDDYNEEKFYQFLEKEKILFIVKPHPFDERFYKQELDQKKLIHPNIKIIFNEDMSKNNFYFYEFFQHADLMITDFSSIAIDFLITKKPVIFLDNLSDEYSQNRGFILEDNYQILMPGEKVKSFNKLLHSIQDALTVDSWKEEREKTLPLLHKHQDNKSCERIYNIIKDL